MALDTQPRVHELSLRPIVTITPEDSLRSAARTMRSNNISSLVVNEPAKPVSILTERDLTRALADGVDPDTPLAALASSNPLTVAADATAIDAATRMLCEGVRHLVVTSGNRAVGVVSIRDLLGILVQSLTPDAVYVMVRQAAWCDIPENWLG
jgi:signal-transduction protein with cAMP-binding, CBS, and nucleotidyltransferase domain